MTAAASSRSAGSPVLALARVEGRRLLRPVPLGLMLLPAVFWPSIILYPAWNNDTWVYWRLIGLWVALPAVALAMESNAAIGRGPRSGTEDLEHCLPLPGRLRVAAHLLALAAPVSLVAALTVLVWLLRGRHGLDIAYAMDAIGIMIDPTWTPGSAELVQAPLVLALAGALGVLTGTLRPLRLPGVVGVNVVIAVLGLIIANLITIVPLWAATPFEATAGERAFRFLPIINPVIYWENYPGTSVVLGVDAAGIAWHDLYLLGLTTLSIWAALRRHGPDRRLRWLCLFGVIATALGGTAQLQTPTAQG